MFKKKKETGWRGIWQKRQKRQEQCEGKENVDKRAVDSGRVGERAKEALSEWLGMAWMACD